MAVVFFHSTVNEQFAHYRPHDIRSKCHTHLNSSWAGVILYRLKEAGDLPWVADQKWLESMDVSNRTLVVYILPRNVHVELQLIVNTLSVTQLYVPRLFVGRMVVWATAEVEVHVGVFLINNVTQ